MPTSGGGFEQSYNAQDHIPVLIRFAADVPTPETDDPVVKMAHRLSTKTGRALYGIRKQTVEPVFGIIKRLHVLRAA